ELARALVDYLGPRGGRISLDDLAAYRVIRRRPVRASFLGHELDSNPPPSAGGLLIAYGLRLLDAVGAGGPPGSAEAMSRLVEIAREQAHACDAAFFRGLYRGGLPSRLLADDEVAAGAARV